MAPTDQGPSFGWIVQPALFVSPPGTPPGSWDLARSILAADEAHARHALDAGFDTIWVEDHMDWVDRAHLECLTTLAWLAARVPAPRLGTMVCGQGFRHPSYLAKAALNLNVLSAAQVVLGIGAGNNEGEHRAFGFPFPPAAERIDAVAEQIVCMRALWTGRPAHVEGQRWTLSGATLAPAPRPPIEVMVGGGGERRTLRVVAEHADWWCADIGSVDTFRHKAAVLDRHCAEVGRDPREIVRSQVIWVGLGGDSEVAEQLRGLPVVRGTADEVTRELSAYRSAGVEHFQVRFLDFPGRRGMETFAEKVMPRLS